jgi:hypothetical protein
VASICSAPRCVSVRTWKFAAGSDKSAASVGTMGSLRTATPQPGLTPFTLNTAAACGVFRYVMNALAA